MPVCLLVYFILPRDIRFKNYALLLMSLIFYAWGEPIWVLLMLFSSFVNYYGGYRIGNANTQREKKFWLILTVTISLALLGIFKYTGFMLENLNLLTGLKLPAWKIGLPLGISFFTFQALSYTLDMYKGTVSVQRSYAYFLLYVSLFPQLIAGPIVRYADVEKEISDRTITLAGFSRGIMRFLTGLAKKLLIANYADQAVRLLLVPGTDNSVFGGWLGLLMFAFQLYFDFSAYSDMAIGLGRMFGFNFKENFNYPYTAKTVTDFWRRWHISLSSFFRDYVYIPLGGNRKHAIRNLFVVWLLTGLWHGASWNYVFFGVYYGILLVLEKYVFEGVIKKLPSFVTRIVTLYFVLMSWALFYFEDLSALGHFLKRIYGLGNFELVSANAISILSNYSLLIVVSLIASTPIGLIIKGANIAMTKAGNKLRFIAMSARLLYVNTIMAVCTVVMVTNTYNPFLYFRF